VHAQMATQGIDAKLQKHQQILAVQTHARMEAAALEDPAHAQRDSQETNVKLMLAVQTHVRTEVAALQDPAHAQRDSQEITVKLKNQKLHWH